jgi:hypothetical protein
MKQLALVLGASLALAGCAAKGVASVRFVEFEGTLPATAMPAATFDNRTRTIQIEVDGGAGEIGSLRADLFQVAGALALPLAKDIELQKNVALGEMTRLRISLKFPAVKRRTEILARFNLDPGNGQAAHTLGDLHFEIFPASTTKDLTALLQTADGTARVELFGPGHKLRQFFASLHVPFEDGGEGVPDNFESSRLYLGEFMDAAQFQEIQDRAPTARILVFAPDESLPPGAYLDRNGSSIMGHVTAPLLDNLADDPRAQLALTKLLTLLSSSPTNPSSL